MIGVQKEFFEASSIPHDIIGHLRKAAMPFVDVFDLAIASFKQWNTLKHCYVKLQPRPVLAFFAVKSKSNTIFSSNYWTSGTNQRDFIVISQKNTNMSGIFCFSGEIFGNFLNVADFFFYWCKPVLKTHIHQHSLSCLTAIQFAPLTDGLTFFVYSQLWCETAKMIHHWIKWRS